MKKTKKIEGKTFTQIDNNDTQKKELITTSNPAEEDEALGTTGGSNFNNSQ